MNNQLPYYFRMFLALAYVILGIFLMSTKAGEQITGKKEFGLIFGLVCIIYGLFRAYRNQKKWDKPTHER